MAARSPVFEGLSSSYEDIGSIHLTVDRTFSTMMQFVMFIYTEKIGGTGLSRSETDAIGCRIPNQDVGRSLPSSFLEGAYALSADKMSMIASHLDTGSRLF